VKEFTIKLILLAFMNLLALCSGLKASPDQQLDSLRYQLELAREEADIIRILVEISRIYQFSDLALSLSYSKQALEMASKYPDSEIYSFAKFNKGNVLVDLGLFESAVKHFSEYAEIMKARKKPIGYAYALANLGAISLNMEQLDDAERYFLNALEIFNQATDENPNATPASQIIHIYNNLGVIHQQKGNYKQAVDYYERGISLARRADGQLTILAMLHNNTGSVYLDMAKPGQAFNSFNDALEIRLRTGDKIGEASSYRMLGLYHSYRNKPRQAEQYYKKAYTLASEIGNTPLIAEISRLLFEHYQVRQQADSALKYHILLNEFRETMNREETLKELTRIELTAKYEEIERSRLIEQKRRENRYTIAGLFLVMLLVILGLLYFLSLSRMRRLRLEQENMNLVSENLRLEKINLENELEIRNKELATNVMYQIRKNELIHLIVQKLLKYSQRFRKEDQYLLIDVIKDLEKTQESKAWNEFELRFQQVHNEFYDKLNEINPELSPNDRRLCAFLRLNMTTKEISTITGQSVRSIEVARTRLRKKLNLTNAETGLIEFLSTL
jgi:tetratricopeptide (TPR) repeat protein